MRIARDHRVCATAVAFVLTLVCTAMAQYSGGTGEPNDPYQIATVADLIALGDRPEDYDKHFVLTADIDLDPNLPGGRVFDTAVIAPGVNRLDPNLPAPLFAGVFDGNGHTLAHLTVHGASYVGLFGQLASGAQVTGLGVVDADITGHYYTGGVVGYSQGALVACGVTGSVEGGGVAYTGGLVGCNDGHLLRCYSTSTVIGAQSVGGLAGANDGAITQCYSTGTVRGSTTVGGLVGRNSGSMVYCSTTSAVSGTQHIGGLVGLTDGGVAQCYSAGAVTGGTSDVGGLVGSTFGHVTGCFWDTQSSGWATSAGGTGKTTAEMQDVRTYRDAGWDWVDTVEDGTSQIWQMPPEGGYPVLAIFHGHTPPQLQGAGTPQNPYQISDARELGAMVHYGPYVHYRLAAAIDLAKIRWAAAVLPSLGGTFDGSALRITHLTVEGGGYAGLFGWLAPGAEVRNLGVGDVNIVGASSYVGGLVGKNEGVVTRCFSTGAIRGDWSVGGIVGSNRVGTVTLCRSSTAVTADNAAGGIVGYNFDGTIADCYSNGAVSSSMSGSGGLVGFNDGAVTACCSTGTVFAKDSAGGLAGLNTGAISNSYATGEVTGTYTVGGLVGTNMGPGCDAGTISNCYAAGAVWGETHTGGLVGSNVCEKTGEPGIVTHCFWDTWTSGQAESSAGTGRTRPEMQTAATFLDAGWDLAGETANGTEDIWWVEEGKDYPRLWWEAADEEDY
jgi:hypothetical protein